MGSNTDKIRRKKDELKDQLKKVLLERQLKEGIVLGYKVSKAGLEVDKAKIELIFKLPPQLISK
ncbi:hypothetical protein Tco_0105231, partial [Tanacetum coccineum]